MPAIEQEEDVVEQALAQRNGLVVLDGRFRHGELPGGWKVSGDWRLIEFIIVL